MWQSRRKGGIKRREVLKVGMKATSKGGKKRGKESGEKWNEWRNESVLSEE